MSDEVDDRIGQILDSLQPRLRQRSGYKSDHILRNYDKLLRAKNELGWSYKDLADLLTKEGRPTKVPTLKYNMRRIAAQRSGATQSTNRAANNGQQKRQSKGDNQRASGEHEGATKGTSIDVNVSDASEASAEGKQKDDLRTVQRLAAGTTETAQKRSTGTIQRFTR